MRWLLILVLVLQILLVGGMVYQTLGPVADQAGQAARALEATRTKLAGSLNRVHQQQGELLRLQQALLHRLAAGAGDSTSATDSRSEPSAPPESAPDREADLLREIVHLQARRAEQEANGHEVTSLDTLLDQRVGEFIDRGAPALALLAEELRSHRDMREREFILLRVLPPFHPLDADACFRAARQVLMDAAARAPIRVLAARQAVQFASERALDDILDILRLDAGKGAEDLRAGLLRVLADSPIERAAQAIRSIAVNPQWGVKVQTQAIRTLAHYPGAQTTEVLRRVIEDGLVYAKVAALESLASISGKEILPYLSQLLEKDPEQMASAVRAKAEALKTQLESGS